MQHHMIFILNFLKFFNFFNGFFTWIFRLFCESEMLDC